jgi:hypothetical protein
MDFNQPPKPDQHALLVYMIGRLKELEDQLQRMDNGMQRSRREGWFLTALTTSLHWIGTLSSYISTAFIAGYIAIEHTWYFEKVSKWISMILSWHL